MSQRMRTTDANTRMSQRGAAAAASASGTLGEVTASQLARSKMRGQSSWIVSMGGRTAPRRKRPFAKRTVAGAVLTPQTPRAKKPHAAHGSFWRFTLGAFAEARWGAFLGVGLGALGLGRALGIA